MVVSNLEFQKKTGLLYFPGAKLPIAKVVRFGRKKCKVLMVIPAHKEKWQDHETLDNNDKNIIRNFLKKSWGESFHVMFLPNTLVSRYNHIKGAH